MPFIPHTESEKKAMLEALEVKQLDDLFDEIPPSLRVRRLEGISTGLNEMELTRLMKAKAAKMGNLQCYLGAGAYEHHIPAAVWDLTQRGEFLTAYTPYQAEASQGSLQLTWEYQTMMAQLMGLEISNASLYDGGSALAEAVLMAIRIQRKGLAGSVWIPQTVNPFYRSALKSLLEPQEIPLNEIPFDETKGTLSVGQLDSLSKTLPPCSVLIIPQPNFFGLLEEVNALTDWGQQNGAVVIGVVNPLAMAWLKPPGHWGKQGADIACGEGQPLGVPLTGGGPYFGFLSCRQRDQRQLPGRVVGKTVDRDNHTGYVLTLQAREQHIRRKKATSNICTNQGLMVTAATIYLSLLGPIGLKRVAKSCHERTQAFIHEMSNLSGVKRIFTGSHFHETLWQLPIDVHEVLQHMAQKGIAAGFAVEKVYPQLKNTLLVCVTETKTDEELKAYVSSLAECL